MPSRRVFIDAARKGILQSGGFQTRIISGACYNPAMQLLPDFRVRQRDYLLEISRAMTSQLELDEVLSLILEAAASMLAGQVGLIALREQGATAFRVRASLGVTVEGLSLFSPLLENLLAEDGHGLRADDLDHKLIKLGAGARSGLAASDCAADADARRCGGRAVHLP